MVGPAAARNLGQRLLNGVDAVVGGRGAQVGACLLGRPAAVPTHIQAGDPDPRGDPEPDHPQRPLGPPANPAGLMAKAAADAARGLLGSLRGTRR